MIHWKLPVAMLIGGLFVYVSNRKTDKKLKDHFENKEKEEYEQKATKKENENIH